MAHTIAAMAYRSAEFGADLAADLGAEAGGERGAAGPLPTTTPDTGAGFASGDPAMLRSLLDQTPTPTALVEGGGDLCSFANAAFRALGVVVGAGVVERFPALPPTLLDEARRTGLPQRSRASGDRVPDGERFWDVRVTPMMGVNGVVRGLIVTAEETPDSAVEHDRRLRDVSHRVKNTLQLVSSLLTLQTLSSKDPEVRRALQNAGSRIGIVTQAHQRTHAALRAGTVDIAGHLRELCLEMEATLPGAHRIQVTAQPTDLPVDAIIPFSLIVAELVVNAAKHAFPSGAPGLIEVRLGRSDAGAIRLEVADQGSGLPAGLEITRAATLGLKVVRAFVGQLRGTLSAASGPFGTRVTVDLPA
ncbi:sensor histidine kinase [Azospirillum sp. TSO35-2]|uniref:sensor histidine kinase n=1 Tax=Azospirillum sp. TSO35-2 TaxID=716796 RepID=UPI000D60D57B|nr:sensor histidine kinase [Azospirillum sp. TSO35-2]PWC35793.1 histidine kinase [Azospirillum sp. TSO35-2]